MQENQLKNILEELYALDSSLRNYESELVELIIKMKNIKPDTKFDAVFAAKLKEKLMTQLEKKTSSKDFNKKTSNFNFMNKKIFVATGSLAIIGVVVLAFFVYYYEGYLPTRNIGEEKKVAGVLIDSSLTQEGFISLPKNAFGSLAGLNAGAEMQSATGSGESTNTKVAADNNIIAPALAISDASVSSDRAPSRMLVSDEGVVSGKMIVAPYYNFKYVYKGEALDLKEETAPVYRRLKGDRAVAKELAASFSGLDSLGFGLKSLDNLKVTSLSLVEDKDFGLMINFDFNEDNIYISENWAKWTYPERDACGNDQSCWDKYRMKIENIPTDSVLINMADKFLSDHKIDRAHYGEAQVDNSWRDNYNKSEDKTNYYIPEYATVIYPLMLDGQAVKNQSGTYVGLQVTINLLRNAVSGLSGLTPYRYETSDYSLETSADEIIKVAENGGWNRNYYIQSENVQTIELGTPERAYVQVYKYENNNNRELLVPALIFPVINLPENSVYYGNKSIVVPLVTDLLKEIDNQPVPMYRTMMQSGIINGGNGATGSDEVLIPEPMMER